MNAAGSEGVADDGHKGAKVQNGTIQKFFLNGIGLRSAPHSTVTRSTITNEVSAFQSDGVDVLFSAGTTVIVGNVLDGNQNEGTEVNSGSDHTVLVRNHAATERTGSTR